MPRPTQEHRLFTIVVGVIREALRYSNRDSVIIAGGGPEAALLERWLEAAGIPFELPTQEFLEKTTEWLHEAGEAQPSLGKGPSRRHLDQEASELAAQALAFAHHEESLLLGTANKTHLLLGYGPAHPPILPLGDLYASQILELAGGCTLPAPLTGMATEEISAVDSALRAYFEDGRSANEAFRGLEPGRARQIRQMLQESSRLWHPLPLIPKLGEATLGLDLDL
jgi:hypothetical protein